MKKMEYETLGVMLDMSRNAVMSVEALKKYLADLAKMGYNCVFLYTEDTYEADGEPLFGYMRSRYSKREMRVLDDYAASIGVELIPCIQTLAHFDAFLHWNTVKTDRDNILLVDDDRSYEFIENLIKTLRACFRTKRIHIGMDEAHMLGRGKHLDIHGYETAATLMKRHLAKVNEIVKKYDFQPMIWSDMFFRSICNDKYYVPKMQFPQEIIDSVPENVIPVYWDYYQEDPQVYDDMMYNHEQLSDKTWFAGGAWCWNGFMPANNFSLKTMLPAIDACEQHGIKNIFFTMWGDNGAECSRYAVLPALYYFAEYMRGNKDEAKIKAGFKKMFDADFDAFMSLGDTNACYRSMTKERTTGSKVALFSDLFNGYMDEKLIPGFETTFASYAKQYHAYAKKFKKWSYLFENAAALCDVLAVKYTLGARTRAAYQAGDKKELLRLAKEEYVKVYDLVKKFHAVFERQWFTENKTGGFDVQDIRIGGVLQRIDSCRRRLVAYAKGEITEIEELEVDLVTLPENYKPAHNYRRMATLNNL